MAPLIRSEADPLREVLVSPPLPSYGDVDMRVHNWVARPDLRKASEEHAELVDLLRDGGAKVDILPGDLAFPNHIYPRDTALVGPRGAWLSRFGLPSRRGEEQRVGKALEAAGVPLVGATRAPGTFEGGGDAFVLGATAFVGVTERTNGAGAEQVASFLRRDGIEARLVRVGLSFHLGEPLGIVDDRTLLVDERWSSEPAFRDFERIEVPASEVGGGNVLVLGRRKLIIHDGYPETIRRLRAAGVDVIPADLTELKKAGGGPQCLTLPLRRG